MPVTANRDLKNHAYQILKERLINCIYEPGTFLNEAQLAANLGLSRTPIREAIKAAVRDVFVEPGSGLLIHRYRSFRLILWHYYT